jgi:preprotein translocase subunit SecA
MFAAMLGRFESDVIEKLYSVRIADDRDVARMEEQRRRSQRNVQIAHASAGAAPASGTQQRAPQPAQPAHRAVPKVGRNDECPCGSGKKYKKCHGKE